MTIDAGADPLAIFEDWMAAARAHAGIREPTAMAVATLDAAGQPHARVVLCKSWSPAGFVFFTNYESRKGRNLEANEKVAAVFYWDALFRQVKVSGRAERTARAESVAYWESRARGSQLSQYISAQSRPVGSRARLEAEWAAAETEFAGRPIRCPAHWGGIRIVPGEIEFWDGRPNRLHDRHQFRRGSGDGGWTHVLLYP